MSNKIITEIMEKINNNEIKPHSKFYFIISLLVLVFVTIIFFILSSFFLNTLFFNFYSYRSPFLGINPQVPWPAIVITIFTFGVGIYLFRKFEISYTKSFMLLFILIISIVGLFGYFMSKTNINHELLTNREYKKIYMKTLREEDWIQGIVIEKSNDILLVKDTSGDLFNVIFNDKTLQPTKPFQIRDCIKAVGNIRGDTLTAKGLSRCGIGKGMGKGGGSYMMKNNRSN